MTEQQQSKAPETDKETGADEGGFSEAFRERVKAPSGDDQKPPEDKAADEAAAEGQPADKAGEAEAPAKAAADEGTGTKAEAFDPFAGLTPEQKAHFEKLAASERSQRGRVGALTKKLNQLTDGTPQSPPEKKPEGAASGNGDGAGEEKPPEAEKSATDIEAKLAEVAEEYGDILGPLPDLVKGLRKELDGLKASATRHEVDQDAEALAEAITALEGKHPDFAQIAEDPKFHTEWLGKQPKSVIELANSNDPQEVSLVLTLFKAESGTLAQASGASEEGKPGSTASGQRRERQLDGLRDAPSRGAPAAAGTPNDFSAAFKQRAKAK